ncbi:hypothetical protein RHMOL_Rhmol10G0160200 [Rhododendron molle]|uniref:Uncharacterized protein n=1 Tax=Rhododendron molle TaxID=49168 RepID=A0ACC0M2W7_RHOML|nr:hypothetical protein RHMOL_Rhmol10G0160200 [Rhododendron molle]
MCNKEFLDKQLEEAREYLDALAEITSPGITRTPLTRPMLILVQVVSRNSMLVSMATYPLKSLNSPVSLKRWS